MNKINNKGFMMAEIIVVAVVIVIALVGLFTTFTRIFIEYEKRVVYNTIDAMYVSKGIIKNNGKKLVKEELLVGTDDYIEVSPNEYTKKSKVVKSYILYYSKEKLESFVNSKKSEIGEKFSDYIYHVIQNNDFSDYSNTTGTEIGKDKYDYIIITELSDNCNASGICNENDGKLDFGYYKFNIVQPIATPESGGGESGGGESGGGESGGGESGGGESGGGESGGGESGGGESGGEVINVNITNVEITYPTRSYNDNQVKKFYINYEATFSESVSDVFISINNSSGTQIDTKQNFISENGKVEFDASSYSVLNNIYAKVCPMKGGFILEEYCSTSAAFNLNFYYIFQETHGTGVTVDTTDYPDNKLYFTGDSASFTFGLATTSNYYVKEYKVVQSDGKSIVNNTNYHLAPSKSDKITISGIANDFTLKVVTEKDNSCLAEGTKILLANGRYKNIENIDYNDLLTVIDYQNGGITYQYPIWIENAAFADTYRLVTFSDGTYLKIIGEHSLFSLDDNKFVDVTDTDNFYVGINVAKLENGKLKKVKVEKIDIINEKIKYYHVVSTRYYNVIANDIVTTAIMNSEIYHATNLYGFDSNIKWKESMLDDVYKYEETSFIPYFLFKGLRFYDNKYFASEGYGIDYFSNYLQSKLLDIWNKPKLNKNNKREWMVTTSEDIVTEDNKLSYLMEEGDYYTLKAPIRKDGKKFIGWLHTGENIMYQPGDKVEVIYGTHFVAKYQDLFNNIYYDKLTISR